MSDYKWYPDDYQLGIEPQRQQRAIVASNTKIQDKKKIMKKPWIMMVVVALVTSILCTGVFGAFVIVPMIKKTNLNSAVIFKDGSDMRNKIDVSNALALQGNSASGQEPLSVVEIARRVGPAVVGIVAKGQSSNSLFTIPSQSSGSGIIISPDGYIVTNNHVIANATSLKVILNNKDEYEARLIGADAQTDLAVIKIEASGLTSAVLGNSGDVEVGEIAVAIGNPLGQELAGTVTTGIISATNRIVTVDDAQYTLLQTDAAINNGNSGGALVNAYGEVIGINTVKMASTGVEGLGFAIPTDVAKPIIEDLMSVGYVKGRPEIGINCRNITKSMSEYYGLPVGVYVANVIEFSSAEKAGIRPGDIIIKFDGQKVETADELNECRDKKTPGDSAIITLVRDGKTIEISIVIGESKPMPDDLG